MSILWFFILLVYVQGAPVTLDNQTENSVENCVPAGIKKIVFFKEPTILFQHDPNLSYETRKNINESMEYLKEFSCLEFKEITEPVSNYSLYFTSRSDSKQGDCWGSPIETGGQSNPTRAMIGVGERCDRGIITYLILRGLGFVDEHRRSDRDEYVEFFCDNINLAKDGIEELFPKLENNYLNNNYTFPYDYNSITHLGANRYAKDVNKPTIKAIGNRNVTFQAEYNRNLSILDVVKINAAYDCFNVRPEYFSPTRMSWKLNT